MKRRIIVLLSLSFLLFTALFSYLLLDNALLHVLKSLPTVLSSQTAPPMQLSPYISLPPSLETIFSDNHDWIATLSATHIRSMLATGDIIPARSVNAGIIRHNNYPLWPFEKVQDWFTKQHADITFVNLESPQITPCPMTDEGMVFCGNQQNVRGLDAIGVTVANLANNHMGNHGMNGIQQTIALLLAHNITPSGTGEAVVKNINGLRFAFLGFNDIGKKEEGISWADENDVQQKIMRAKQLADVVIVQFHWGIEYQAQPSDRQIQLGHLAIDSGADLVIGNHPHWIQPVEIYKNKLITYAHGNFIFDQMWSLKTRQGVIGKYTFYDTHLIDVQYFPLQIDTYAQAHFVDGEEKQTILSDMQTQSLLLENTLKNKGN